MLINLKKFYQAPKFDLVFLFSLKIFSRPDFFVGFFIGWSGKNRPRKSIGKFVEISKRNGLYSPFFFKFSQAHSAVNRESELSNVETARLDPDTVKLLNFKILKENNEGKIFFLPRKNKNKNFLENVLFKGFQSP
jgi:hypothetical protein